MTNKVSEKLRDKDHAVLQYIGQGEDDVQKITSITTLENHHVAYCFEKLEELGLIEVEKPDRMVERIVDGQKRVFQHPKQARLTDKARKHLKESETTEETDYSDMSHKELVETVYELENRVDQLEQKLGMFQKQVQQKL
jgi:predicted transcriptional regulator